MKPSATYEGRVKKYTARLQIATNKRTIVRILRTLNHLRKLHNWGII